MDIFSQASRALPSSKGPCCPSSYVKYSSFCQNLLDLCTTGCIATLLAFLFWHVNAHFQTSFVLVKKMECQWINIIKNSLILFVV